MFGRTPKVDAIKLNEAKNLILDDMLLCDPGSERYSAVLEQLERVSALEKTEVRIQMPDSNTMLQTAGTLLGVAIIVGYEHGHVITSKAFNIVFKGKA